MQRNGGRNIGVLLAQLIGNAIVGGLFRSLGRADLEKARLKLNGMVLHPRLGDALELIVAEKLPLVTGADFIKDDAKWQRVAARLVDFPFQKRGTAAYFIRYLMVMDIAKTELISRKTAAFKTDEIANPGVKGLVDLYIDNAFKQTEGLLMELFGYLHFIREEHTETPSGLRESATTWLWKTADGAMKSDYLAVEKFADEFLVGSLFNSRIDDILEGPNA